MRGCRPLSNCEISRLLSTLSAPEWRRERTLILIGLRTGLRLTSMLSLRVGDVAIAGEVQNRIRVRRSTVKGKRAGNDMPLHSQASAALQDHIDTLPDRSPDAFLFRGRRPGTRLSKTAGWRAIKRAFRAAGIVGAPSEIGTHTLRKTFARLIYAALGHDLVRTSYAMRHASVATTIKYLSFREEEVDAAIMNLLAACRTEKRAAKAAGLRFFSFGDHFLISESLGRGTRLKFARFSLGKVTG